MPELLMEALRRLRAEAGYSRRELSHRTVRLGYEGVPESTIEALETKPGRIPDAEIIEALAAALDVPPATFYEWPVAVARRAAKTPAAEQTPAQIAEQAAARIEGSPPEAAPAPRKPRRSGRAA